MVVMEKDIWKCTLHARCSLVLAKMCAVKRVTLALFVCFSGRCNCYALSFCCYSSANIVMILDSWLCIYLSFAPRPSHRPVFDCLQYAKTASNQKLDGGKAWERSCTLVSQARPNQPQHGSLSGLHSVRDTESDLCWD